MLYLLEFWDNEYSKISREIKNDVLSAHKENYYKTTQILQTNLYGIGVESLPTPLLINYNDVSNGDITLQVDRTLSELDRKVKSALSGGFNEKDFKGLADSVNIIKSMEKSLHGTTVRLMRLYRTESTRLRGRTALFIKRKLRAMGIKVELSWVHVMSNTAKNMSNYHPRKDHVEINGQLPDLEGYYILPNGNKTKAPAEFGIPSEDYNCQCSLAFVKEK